MSRRSAVLGAAALAAAALIGGCHTCDDHDGADRSVGLAKFNYENGKYDQARILYTRAVELCPGNVDGWLGLANACRETGNNEFKSAADMAAQGKIQDSKRIFKTAAENHALSYEILQRRIKESPDDMAPHYALGMLFYQRATSVLPFPFPVDDTVNRPKERDLAIAEFKQIVSKAPRAWQAHRYLGLALFAAERMDEGRHHLKIYHDAQQGLYETVLQWPGSSDEEKKRKETALQTVNKEIEEIRDVLGEYFMMVQRDIERLKLKRDKTPEDEAKLARLNTESLVLERTIKGFHLTRLGPVEQELRRRCDDYLTVFNRGEVAEIMAFVAAKQGDEAALQRAVQDRVRLGTKFRKPQYRTIVVSGETASVGLVCEVVNKEGSRPDSELTMHWRLVGGQWKVSDLP
jgi:tetratricopeptide (TPR) repeat protein